MAWLNYHHLLYFSTVAQRGSIAQAAVVLNLTQPAISAQIKTLERALKVQLLVRRGRRLELTEVGRVVARYAEQIFGLGRDLQEAIAGQAPDRQAPLRVGVVDSLPKALVHRLLAPALTLPAHRLVVAEGKVDRLLGELAIHELEVVLSDAPAPPTLAVRAFSHRVLDDGVTFFAGPKLARSLRGRFPRNLDQSPMLLPTRDSALRQSLEAWFAVEGLAPRVVAEVGDSAVLKIFGENDVGLFAAPAAMAADIIRRHRVRAIGSTSKVRESVYAVTAERRIGHPGVRVVIEAARQIGEE